MEQSAVQNFTVGVGCKFFAVFPEEDNTRQPTECDPVAQELELLESIVNPPWDPELSILQEEQKNRLSPWLTRTGWVNHLGSFPLKMLGESVNTGRISTSKPSSWGATCNKLRQSFGIIWAAAEDSVRKEAVNSSLTLLKTCKRGTYDNQDVAPFKVQEKAATTARYFSLWESYLLFCCRWFQEGFSQAHINDEDKVIVAPHLVRLQDTRNVGISIGVTKCNKRLLHYT